MHNPSHTGLTLKEDVLPALDLTVSKASGQLGHPSRRFSSLINGQAGISSEMALRLEAWLGDSRGGNANTWLSQDSGS